MESKKLIDVAKEYGDERDNYLFYNYALMLRDTIKTKEDLVKEINILVDKKRNFINTLSDEEKNKLDFYNEILNLYILATSSKRKVDGGKRKSRRKRNKRRKTMKKRTNHNRK
jgi:hypothetical protein